MKRFFKRLKENWDRYLERMAESNKKLYGNQRLDCCDLNKKPEINKRKK